MNTERILVELNFLIRTTHDLQLKLQEDGKTSEEMESILSDVLLTGCQTLHTYRVDGGPVYNADELPYLQTLFLNVCDTYDEICGRRDAAAYWMKPLPTMIWIKGTGSDRLFFVRR